ncbi:MAG: hypothetical protein ABIP64_12690, partial [Burkholderiales bacterium]
TIRRVALIGYPAEYFLPFGIAMEDANFEVFWVCALKADAKYLVCKGIPQSRILDANHSFLPGSRQIAECREELSKFENESDPRVNDIILMDRLISKKDWHFSIEYLHHVATSIAGFLNSNKIGLVSSWRDTAIQLIAMLVARKLDIPFVIPTRIRIPQEVYGFCTAHHTESFLALREPAQEDILWAEKFLESFEARAMLPGLKKSSRNFVDVLRLAPSHLDAFFYELRRSFSDMGNDYNRYTIFKVLLMYARRRVNLLLYKLFNPCQRKVSLVKQYCIYALHTQPESSIDVQGSYFSDQIALIKHIARSLPSSHILYVKVHPTDVDGKTLNFYRQIKAIPSVLLVDYLVDSRMLINAASIVFALTGTIAYEAALLRKSVVVFAKNFFNGLPTVHRCETPTALPSLVSKLLVAYDSTNRQREMIISFLARLRASCFDGEVSRSWAARGEGLNFNDLKQLQKAYDMVYHVMADGHCN